MKYVLIITYLFFQKGFIGTTRFQGLTKFLKDFGWKPIVLTVKSSSHQDTDFQVIETQYDDLLFRWKNRFGLSNNKTLKEHVGSKIYKNKKTITDVILNFWEEIFAYPDTAKGWYQYAVKSGGEIIRSTKIDAIISSSYPPTCHLIANKLSKTYGIPWIGDFRDLWTQNHYYSYTPIRKLIEQRLEIKTLSNANALTTVSAPLAGKLKMLHNKTTYAIPNGFDPDEVNPSTTKLTEKFVITYTGALYRGKRDPSALFKVIKDLISKRIVNPNDIEIRFYSPKEDWLEKEIKDYDLHNIAKCYGFVERTEVINIQRKSQLLLLLLWDNPKENGVYTGKIFEYLAAKRPILALGHHQGVVKELLDETNAGLSAISDEEIKKNLLDFYHEWKCKGKVMFRGNKSEINQYSHREMAKKFAKVLNIITNHTTLD